MLNLLENYVEAPVVISWMIDIFGICAVSVLCYSMRWLTKGISNSNQRHADTYSQTMLTDISLFDMGDEKNPGAYCKDTGFISVNEWSEIRESEMENTGKSRVIA